MPNHEQARESPAVPGAGEQIRRLIERLAFQANRAAKAATPDAVHDLRVAIRRAEQALVAFKPQLPRKVGKRIRKQLKAVLSTAGEVRDYDIAIKLLMKTDEPGAVELRREIRTRRKTAERSLLSRLRRLSLRTRISRWLTDLKLHAPQPGSEDAMRSMATSALPRLARRFFEAGESAASHNSGEKLHEFRIRAKKLRYTMELFVSVYGSAVEERIREIKSVQSILGSMNDYRSVLALATELGSDRKLKAWLKRAERRKIRQFREIWGERFSGAAAEEWKRVLHGGVAEPRVARKPIVSSTEAQQDVAARA